MSEKKEYTVKLEFQLIGENPLDVAKQMMEILNIGENQDFVYEVIDKELNESYSVDLSEDDEDAVLPI